MPNDDNPTDRFSALLVQGPSSQGRAKTHFRHMTDINGDVVSDGDDALLDVFQGLDEANATYEVFDLIDFDAAGSHIHIGLCDSSEHLLKGNPEGAHCIRIHIDLILSDKAADRGHFTHAIG